MAETTKKVTDNATKSKRVTVRLPRAKGINAEQDELFSLNGKNIRIKRGETVEISEGVAEIIANAEKAEEYAVSYAESLVVKEKDKMKEIGIN